MSKSKKRHSNSSAVVRAKARDSALADKQVRGQHPGHYSAHRRPGPPVRRQEAGRQAAAQVKTCEKPENHPAEGPEAGHPFYLLC